MKKINIEKSIKRAVNQAPTIDFEKLVNTPVVRMAEHDYITRLQEKQMSNHHKQFSLAFACCFAILVCFSGWFVQFRMPDSVIALDVNPSIEIVTNKQNRILSVKVLNEDAQRVIDGHVYKNADLSDTVDALLSSMISQGYLNIDKNIIMLSVENKNIKKANALSALLDKVIRDSASSRNISPHILRQVFTKDEAASALAEQYSVSVGKIKLINEILSSNTTFSMDELSHMSMRDLLSISKENAIDLHKIIQFDDDYSGDDENNKYSRPSDTDNNNNDSTSPSNASNKNNDSTSPSDAGNNNNDSTSPSDTGNNDNDSVSPPDAGNNNNNGSVSPPDAGTNDNGSVSPPVAGNNGNGSVSPPVAGNNDNDSISPPVAGNNDNDSISPPVANNNE